MRNSITFLICLISGSTIFTSCKPPQRIVVNSRGKEVTLPNGSRTCIWIQASESDAKKWGFHLLEGDEFWTFGPPVEQLFGSDGYCQIRKGVVVAFKYTTHRM